MLAASVTATPLVTTPSAISNTYSGVLTVQVTGLTNGEQVIIERYLDLNANNIIDPGEPLIDAFSIRDGGLSLIGGATNLNVPYDSNPAGGAITTTISFAPPLESIVGQQLFRLVSPTGNFLPQTNVFIITNAALPQTISGNVFAGGAPVANAVVVALRQPNNNYASAAVADNAGHYLLKLNPGTYGLIPALPNYYTDQALSPVVVLTNGGSATVDLFLTNGSIANTLSGQALDATNGNALGGVFLQLQSGNLFAVAFTDSGGNFSAALSSSFWRVKCESSRLARRAYVTSQNKLQVDLTTGSVAGVTIAFPKANAMFYGRLADNFNVPFANVDFYGQDNGRQLKSDGFSDANGNYAVAVLAGATNEWNSSPGTSDNATLFNYLVSNGLGITNILAGQALRQDFTAIRATAQITGRVQDNLGHPVGNMGIFANATINGTQYNTSSATDSSGNYLLPAAAGTWWAALNCCGNNGLDSHGLFDPVNHTISIPPANAVLNITVYPTGTPLLSQPTRFSPSQFAFNLSGSLGANYTVQASTNLGAWFTLFSVNLTSNPMFLQDNQATNRVRFYRAQKN